MGSLMSSIESIWETRESLQTTKQKPKQKKNENKKPVHYAREFTWWITRLNHESHSKGWHSLVRIIRKQFLAFLTHLVQYLIDFYLESNSSIVSPFTLPDKTHITSSNEKWMYRLSTDFYGVDSINRSSYRMFRTIKLIFEFFLKVKP